MPKVSIPTVANQGDLMVLDGDEYIVEQPTGANHYLTLQSVEDPDQHEEFPTASDFTSWWAIREEFKIVRARYHDKEPAENGSAGEEPQEQEAES